MPLRYGTRDDLFKYAVLAITRRNVPFGGCYGLMKDRILHLYCI